LYTGHLELIIFVWSNLCSNFFKSSDFTFCLEVHISSSNSTRKVCRRSSVFLQKCICCTFFEIASFESIKCSMTMCTHAVVPLISPVQRMFFWTLRIGCYASQEKKTTKW